MGVRDVRVPNESHQRTHLGAVDGKVGNGSLFRVELVDGVKDFLDFAGVVLLGDEMEDIPDSVFQVFFALNLNDKTHHSGFGFCVPLALLYSHVDYLTLKFDLHQMW